MTDVALIAGRGRLPVLVAEAAGPAVYAAGDAAVEAPGVRGRFRLERAASFLGALSEQGIRRICLAGGVDRPVIDEGAIEPASVPLIERLASVMTEGDDAALRALLDYFEEAGFEIVPPHALRPDLLPEPGLLTGEIGPRDEADAARAAEILSATGALDIGQGCVVAQGLCLAVEAHPGTDFMLAGLTGDLAGRRPPPERGRGLLMKAPKPDQDRRVDLPVIGAETVRLAARAGLGGIAFEAGGVMVPNREDTVRAAEAEGLFLWCRP